jgi:hypothetical protein
MYYEHQYERFGRLEEQGLIITNVVITLSAAIFGFGFPKDKIVVLNPISGLAVPLLMIIANGFAMWYIFRANQFIGFHQERAKKILELFAHSLWELDQEIQWKYKQPLWRRRIVQLYIHGLLVLLALIPLYMFLVG